MTKLLLSKKKLKCYDFFLKIGKINILNNFFCTTCIKQKFHTKYVQKHFYYTDNKIVKSVSVNFSAIAEYLLNDSDCAKNNRDNSFSSISKLRS